MVEDVPVEGYSDSSYGDGFADVYDDWYAGITDSAATVAALRALAIPGLPVLELGVGTGRLAVPLAAAGVEVHGVDSSEAMLARLSTNDPHHDDPDRMVHPHLADMVSGLPDGPFGLVFVAYNTLFALLTVERQQQCFREVAARLAPGAAFVVEAFVPNGVSGSDVTVRSLTADRVVLSVSISNAAEQVAEGQYIDITVGGGVRLRPWSIRSAPPAELDRMAATAGLELEHRSESFAGAPFVAESARHVSVYRTIHTHTFRGPVHASPPSTS